jgi:hypothetical protein
MPSFHGTDAWTGMDLVAPWIAFMEIWTLVRLMGPSQTNASVGASRRRSCLGRRPDFAGGCAALRAQVEVDDPLRFGGQLGEAVHSGPRLFGLLLEDPAGGWSRVDDVHDFVTALGDQLLEELLRVEAIP